MGDEHAMLVPNAYAQKPHLNPCKNVYASGLALLYVLDVFLLCVRAANALARLSLRCSHMR